MTTLLSVIFFVSGAAALIFETLWFRLAGLAFGNSVWAGSIVLASFMGGIALGNGLSARWGSRIKRPLEFYALMELVISVAGFTIVLFLPLLTHLLAAAFSAAVESPLLLNGLRLAGSFGLMLIPATAMGATLPVLVKSLYGYDRNFGKILGLLYGWNTLGAVAGVLLAETALIKLFGIRGTGAIAAGLNLLAAAAAIAIGRVRAAPPGPLPQVAAGAASGRQPGGLSLMAVSVLCGFVFLALEVIWFRFVLLFFPSSTLTFAIMLAIVLLGISAGGLVASALFRFQPAADRLLFFLLLGNGLTVALSYAGFGAVAGLVRHRPVYEQIALTSFALIFPASLISGVAYTLLGKSFFLRLGDEVRAAGVLTLTNTAGGMLGSLVGGLVLLPFLGLETSFFAAALLYGLAALFLFLAEGRAGAGGRTGWQLTAAAVFIAALFLFPFRLLQERYLDLSLPPALAAAYQRVAYEEGTTETIQYLRQSLLGQTHHYLMMTNSYAMSGTNVRSKRYMKFFVYLPLALQPAARDALLICYGCGSTAKALTDARTLARIDFVDISREIFELSRVVYPVASENPINDPRVTTHVEDGRFHLLTTERRYDLITAEPPPPRVAGVVNLYTREYFQLLHDRLNPGGIVTYWLPVYQMEPEESKSILRAFSDVFGNCSLWTGAGLEWMMVGVRDPLPAASSEGFLRQWRDDTVLREMQALGFADPGQMGSLFIADRAAIREWVAGAPPLTDDRPRRLSPHSGSQPDLSPYLQFMDPARSRDEFLKSAFIRKAWPDTLRDEASRHFASRGGIDRMFTSPVPDLTELDLCLRDERYLPYVLWAFRSDQAAQDILGDVIRQGRLEEALRQPNAGELYRHLAARAARERRFAAAEDYLRLATVRLDPLSRHNDYLYSFRAYLLYVSGRKDLALNVLQEYLQRAPSLKPQRDQYARSVWGYLTALDAGGASRQ